MLHMSLSKRKNPAKESGKKIYYKVVEVENRQKKSFLCDCLSKESVVKYSLDSWTEAPKDTRLFVFDSLKDVETWVGKDCQTVYECEVSGVIKEKLLGSARLFPSYIKEYWEIFNRVRKQKKKDFAKNLYKEMEKNYFGLAHTKAVFVKKVKLIKKVTL